MIARPKYDNKIYKDHDNISIYDHTNDWLPDDLGKNF